MRDLGLQKKPDTGMRIKLKQVYGYAYFESRAAGLSAGCAAFEKYKWIKGGVKRMKKIMAAMLTLIMLLIPHLSLADAQTEQNTAQISVTGIAKVVVESDQAQVTFGVEIIEDDAQTAQAHANEVILAATTNICALGIDEKAIETDSISIYREYYYGKDDEESIKFNASTHLKVSLDDISLVGAVIDAGLSAKLNNLSGVTFSSSKHAEYYRQALSEAMQMARLKADIMAGAEGGSVGLLISAGEKYSSSMYSAANSTTMYMTQDVAAGEAEYDTATVINAGTIEISATVDATYEVVYGD